MNSAMISEVSDRLINFLKAKYPDLSLQIDRYSWVTSISIITSDHDYLASIDIKQINYEGDYEVGYIIGESMTTISKCNQSSDINKVVDAVDNWFNNRIKSQMRRYSRKFHHLQSIIHQSEQ